MKDIRVVVISILVVVFYSCSSTGDTVQESGLRGSKPKVMVDLVVDGVSWRQVSSLDKAGPADAVYTIRVGEDGSTLVVFGDGQHGARIPAGSRASVTYRYGGGDSGDEMTLTWKWTPHDVVEELVLCARIGRRDRKIEFQRRPCLESREEES
ncbi:MAG: hypothetical protein WBG01_05220 [Bacteroidota bacterium]